MSTIDDIYEQLPVAAIAARLGVEEATARDAISEALPALVGGLAANAADPAGAASLQKAVARPRPGLLAGRVDLSAVDTADGEKIVDHVFGAKKPQVVQTLGSTASSSTEGIIQKLLPILAPIVLSYLASKVLGGSGAGSGSKGATGAASGGLGEILGGLLGGSSDTTSSKSTSPTATGGLGGIGDILGGLLGGGTR